MTENTSNAILPDNCPLPWSRRNVNAAFQVADANGNHFLTAQMWNRGAAVPDDLLDYIVTAANNYSLMLEALRKVESELIDVGMEVPSYITAILNPTTS
jgi:hypothetical protein